MTAARSARSASSSRRETRNRSRGAPPPVSSAGVPAATIRPRSMMATRSASRSTSSSSWVVEQDGRAGGPQRRDAIPGRPLGRGVHARGRLVEDQQLRAAEEREGQREALLLAARQPPVAGPRGIDRGRRPRAARRVLGVAVEAAVQPEHLARRGPVVDAALLEHQPDPRPEAPSVPRRVQARAPAPSRRPAVDSPRGSRPSSSCRRRWGPAARTARRDPPRMRRRRGSRAARSALRRSLASMAAPASAAPAVTA